jgi:hypothetical protein
MCARTGGAHATVRVGRWFGLAVAERSTASPSKGTVLVRGKVRYGKEAGTSWVATLEGAQTVVLAVPEW